VRGRVDHKEAGKTCLVVQTVEAFAPSQEELDRAQGQADAAARTATNLAQPIHMCVALSALSDAAIDELKQAIEDFPGAAEILLDIDTPTGTRRLRLGEAYRVQHTSTLLAELEHALAPVLPASATA
jgi:DNA polymerase III subunit alpha